MDEMKIGSKFTTGIISKLIGMVIRKKFGYEVTLKLNEVNATVIDGKTHVHLDVDAELDKEELMKILSPREIYKSLYERRVSSVGRAPHFRGGRRFESDTVSFTFYFNERRNHEH